MSVTPADGIPRTRSPDSTLAFLSEGYRFIGRRCDRLGADAFRTRLGLRSVVCARGEDAVRMFYHPDRFTRRGAIPLTTLMLLQDRGSVQTLDAEGHRHRKGMFMRVLGGETMRRLPGIMVEEWRERLAIWAGAPSVVLHREVQGILTRSACRWAGVPLGEAEAERRTRELAAMIEGAGSVGLRNWRGLLLRTRTERWARGVIRGIREGSLSVPDGSPAAAIATHRELDGALLDPKVAGVELINLLRPTVAVARYVTFAALALHEHPAERDRLRSDPGGEHVERFVQEVRRYYPFFPAVGGRAREAFEWRGHRFEEGAWVMLDLYGTNRDPRLWDDAESFRPDRFRARDPGAYDLVPQGGGDHFRGHRCAGEWATIALVQAAVGLLASGMGYDVPPQDLTIDLSRMPAIPASRFVIRNVAPA